MPKSNISRDQIARLIAKHVNVSAATLRASRGVASIEGIDKAADAIWGIVAKCIEESEHRVIDAEFKAQALQPTAAITRA